MMSIMRSHVVRFNRGVCGVEGNQNPLVLPAITVALAIPGYDGLLPITALGAALEVNIPGGLVP